MKGRRVPLLLLAGFMLPACGGGGGGGGGSSSHPVTISWTANRESAVNSVGGGYRVSISGQAPIDVPYVSPGPLAPTSVTTTLVTGSYTVTVIAYSALSSPAVPLGGSTSAASAPIVVHVP